MHWTPRRERFRALLATGRCYHPGSVYDAISARIAEAESRADLDPGLPRAERLAVPIEPANMPISKPRSSAMRAEMAS